MNRVGNCGAMQYVQSMEIDPTTGLMWVIDNGRINIFAEGLPPNNRCPPQVLRINVDTGEVLSRAVLPEPVVRVHTEELDIIFFRGSSLRTPTCITKISRLCL